MIDAVSEIYGRKLSTEENQQVAALWLYNFKDAMQTNNFQQSMAKWSLNEDKIIQIGERKNE